MSSTDTLSFDLIIPELFVFGLVSLVLLIEALGRSRHSVLSQRICEFSLLGLSIYLAATAFDVTPSFAMNGLLVIDPLGQLLKAMSTIVICGSLFYAHRYLGDRSMNEGEFQLFALFSLLGQFLMISGAHLLTIYLGIELLALSLYAAVALRRDCSLATEAAMKYFVLGALASGFLLYGMSMIYGASGSLFLPEISDKLLSGQADRLVMVFGVVFIVAGLAFKAGAVPFHMWVPDVYQGSPTAATLLVGGAPKFAAFAITIRLLVSGLIEAAADWQQMLLLLAVLSLVVGNFVAIAQTNLKRMLAYSTISHMGFMLLGIASGVVDSNDTGAVDAYAGAMFYVFIYTVSSMGAFGVLLVCTRQGYELETLDQLKGLAKTRPLLGWMLLLLMFSLAGVPPTAGFYAKLVIIEAAVQAGYIALAVFAVVMSLVGAFYYLRIIKLMYFDSPDESVEALPGKPSRVESGVIALNGLSVLVLGLLPGPLLMACIYAVRTSLAAS